MVEKRLLFMLGKRCYSLPVTSVTEVVKPEPVAWIPRVPPHVLGLMNLRGHIIPVVEGSLLFGFHAELSGPETRVIVLDGGLGGEMDLVSLRVEAVLGIVPMPREEIQSRETLVGRDLHPAVAGISCRDGRSVMHLDPNQLIHSAAPGETSQV